jgi:hypothetical protein
MNCACGCGETIEMTKLIKWRMNNGQTSFYKLGHKDTTKQKNGHWKGGVHFKDGYKLVRCPDHPNANKSGYVREHRLIMSDFLQRPLTQTEVVHHKDRNKLNNSIENLELTVRVDHGHIHAGDRTYPPKPMKTCPECGEQFHPQHGNYARDKCCSMKCRAKFYTGVNAPNTKITQEIADRIRNDAKQFSQRALAKRYNLSKTHIGRIVRNESWV